MQAALRLKSSGVQHNLVFEELLTAKQWGGIDRFYAHTLDEREWMIATDGAQNILAAVLEDRAVREAELKAKHANARKP